MRVLALYQLFLTVNLYSPLLQKPRNGWRQIQGVAGWEETVLVSTGLGVQQARQFPEKISSDYQTVRVGSIICDLRSSTFVFDSRTLPYLIPNKYSPKPTYGEIIQMSHVKQHHSRVWIVTKGLKTGNSLPSCLDSCF